MQSISRREFSAVRDAVLEVIPEEETALRRDLAALSAPKWDGMDSPEVQVQRIHEATWLAQHRILNERLPQNPADCTKWQLEIARILRGD